MRIAVAKEGNNVGYHFGHCEGFQIFDIDQKEIKNQKYIENPGHKPGFLPVFLADRGIQMIIAGGMGEKAIGLFEENNIEVIVGAKGSIEDVIKLYLSEGLQSTGSICREHQHHEECHS